MAELPSGTVTMLFSDIQGSTLLFSRLGPAYAEAPDTHRQALRKAWAAQGDTESPFVEDCERVAQIGEAAIGDRSFR